MRINNAIKSRNKYNGLNVLGVIMILMGLVMLLLPLIQPKPYDEYVEKEVVISGVHRHYTKLHNRTHNYYDYITTKDGERYKITGKYKEENLKPTLQEGTVATIKYDDNNILSSMKSVEEISVNGIKVVTYNDSPKSWDFSVKLCLVFCIIGAGCLSFYYLSVFYEKKKAKKREAR